MHTYKVKETLLTSHGGEIGPMKKTEIDQVLKKRQFYHHVSILLYVV